MLRPVSLVLLALVLLSPAAAAADAAGDLPAEYLRAKQQGEDLVAEGSYARARRLYEQTADRFLDELPPAEARWVEFRIADTMWRARAGSNTHDDTIFEAARERLEALVRGISRAEDRDRVWAEAHESLGDFWWDRRNSQNWGQGWQHYQQALEWWAGHRDVELARRRYLAMVWRMAEPQWQRTRHWYGSTNIPLEILENAREIARDKTDRARAHYLLGMGLRRHGGDWQQRKRIGDEFEAALEFGKRNPWYDDALFYYAQWLESNGRVVMGDNGQWRQEPDLVTAVKLYRRLLREFRKGETRYHDQAERQIESITSPQLSTGVGHIFLPGSEIRFNLRWRNLGAIDLALYRIDVTRDIDPAIERHGPQQWVRQVDTRGARKVNAWRFDTKDDGTHEWGGENVTLDEPLPAGAYVLVANGGGETARDVILVSDVAIVLKHWRNQVIAYVCDAVDGSPVPGARMRLWNYRWVNDRWSGIDLVDQSDPDGLCSFKVDTNTRSGESYHGYLVTASVDGRQAFAYGGGFRKLSAGQMWKVYATTDRPAYRPEDTVNWKITARVNPGDGYATPGNETLSYEINGPRGKVDEGEVTLNAFGSAWGELELGETMALGEYRISFWTAHRRRHIGQSQLFRIEEYKLPEFEVAVTTPTDEAGRKKSFRLGETVEAQIQASYYFGGPVANANVEVVVHQRPFYHWWRPVRAYPWYYEDASSRQWWGGHGQVIKRETLQTDASGRATVAFETPLGHNQDLQYRVEARVTDQSRREIAGADTVRVTRQRYYVYPRARHNLYRPGDKVEVELRALDANEQPVSVEGTVTVTRERWVEIWVDPSGHEVSGWQLRAAREQFRVFPPPPDGDGAAWEIKFRGYSSQEILTRRVRTDDNGEALLGFEAADEGYYRVAWASLDDGQPINAQTTVWVADRDSVELGYRPGGVEIVVDKDTFRAGETAAVMLSVPTNDRFVLFSVEGDDLHDFRLVHVKGTVKLVEVPIADRHIPNVYLNALMVSDGRIHADREEVVVPPVEHFLEVEVTPDRKAYQPQDEGTLTVVTRDVDGNPVPAEVTLALVDESVYFIQQAYAGDPRKFFFDRKQNAWIVQTLSTFNAGNYRKLVKKNETVVDQRELELGNEFRQDRDAPGREAQKSGRAGGFAADEMSVADAPMEMAEEAGLLSRTEGMRAPPAAPAAEPGPGQEPAVVVRSDFRSTLLWEPHVATGEDGTAKVTVTYADNLTRWKAIATAATRGSAFGAGDATTRTRRPLIARLQAPRFFVVGDAVTLSGVFNNNTDEPMTVRPALEVEGLKITGVMEDGRAVQKRAGTLRIAPHAEARVDWVAAVESPGEAKVRLVARGEHHADAMEKTYAVHDHGVERFIASSGKVRGEAVTLRLDIPAARKPESTVLELGVTSSMAVTMLDALPYLIQYPYGCTEQTMSRFVPAVVTAKTLRDMGLSAEDALGRVFGGIERQFVDKTHPKGDQKRANLRKLDVIVNEGLGRLYDFQHGDGGWGWWKTGSSDHFMTAYVLWGLGLAREAGLDVRGHVMERAARYLTVELIERERHPDMQAWMLHALASYRAVTGGHPGDFEMEALENVWRQRDALNAYTRALLALAMHDYGHGERARTLVRNLENGVKRDDAPDRSVLLGHGRAAEPAVIGTAHWGADGLWWRWSDGGVEATAFALRALLAIDPGHELIEPVTNWLVKNRRGAQWSNTRDTAITVLALNDYLRESGELEPDLEYEVFVNGRSIARRRVTGADVLAAPSRFTVNPKDIRDGANEIRISRKGKGPIYFSAEATFFSLEEPIPAAGNEIFVRRDYYKLEPRETLLKGYVYDRVKLHDGDYVTSGERVQVVVTVESKNDYEYLVFEDLKPAGLEAVGVRSGEPAWISELKSGAVDRRFVDNDDGRDGADYTGRRRHVHQELRDRKVALFVDRLPEGVWEITYDMRAEVPGRFHALPVLGHAMYVPEIRCNSREVRITVEDRPPAGIAAAGD